MIKFLDGEELFIKADFSRMGSEDEWFSSAETYLNGDDPEGDLCPNFPASGVSIPRASVKYILKI